MSIDAITPAPSAKPSVATAWRWIPSLYFGQGIPYVVVMTLSVIMYKNMGMSNADIGLYTSWLYLPFVIKPLWSPLVDLFKSKRYWIVCMELLIGSLLGLMVLVIPMAGFFRATLLIFWLISFSAATHDISVDGFYMLALEQHQQAAFAGVRSMFYRIAMLAGQGGLVYLAGSLKDMTGHTEFGWCAVFAVLAVLFLGLAAYHRAVLPHPSEDSNHATQGHTFTDFLSVFSAFFKKKNLAWSIAFLLFYRFGEAQLIKMAQPFLLDPVAVGGLGLSTRRVTPKRCAIARSASAC